MSAAFYTLPAASHGGDTKTTLHQSERMPLYEAGVFDIAPGHVPPTSAAAGADRVSQQAADCPSADPTINSCSPDPRRPSQDRPCATSVGLVSIRARHEWFWRADRRIIRAVER